MTIPPLAAAGLAAALAAPLLLSASPSHAETVTPRSESGTLRILGGVGFLGLSDQPGGNRAWAVNAGNGTDLSFPGIGETAPIVMDDTCFPKAIAAILPFVPVQVAGDGSSCALFTAEAGVGGLVFRVDDSASPANGLYLHTGTGLNAYLLGVAASIPSNLPTVFQVVTRKAPDAPTVTSTTLDAPTGPIRGKAEPGTVVDVFDEWEPLCFATAVSPDGNWECTGFDPLSPGAHTIHAVARNAAEQVSPTTEATVVAPDPAAIPAAPAVSTTTLDSTTGALSGTADPGSIVRVFESGTVDGVAVCTSEIVGGDGAWSCRHENTWKEGANDLFAVAFHSVSGLGSTPTSFTLTVTTPTNPGPGTGSEGSGSGSGGSDGTGSGTGTGTSAGRGDTSTAAKSSKHAALPKRLAFTGSEPLPVLAGALALIAGGVGVLAVRRRRREQPSE
ncbi:LPXTG cell wall anchor domain-containing protein [Frondihabitans cladoniiphilus]|uniref:Gram-positive cocci surface proteins LPxTG domain-containing protein n=1 Tax=Frondihabitans cladoniiphilus TaxID=715785 RepID=A0ABP8W302_9MICO